MFLKTASDSEVFQGGTGHKKPPFFRYENLRKIRNRLLIRRFITPDSTKKKKNCRKFRIIIICLNYTVLSKVHSREILRKSKYCKYSFKRFYCIAVTLNACSYFRRGGGRIVYFIKLSIRFIIKQKKKRFFFS